MMVHAFTDGASRGNPGESGIGIIFQDEKGKVLKSIYAYIGEATNNIAEYTALIVCLKHAQKLHLRNLVIHSDSELLVRQMEGMYKVKEPRLRRLFEQAQALIDANSFQCTFRHVTRDHNREADRLANLGIDSRRAIQI